VARHKHFEAVGIVGFFQIVHRYQKGFPVLSRLAIVAARQIAPKRSKLIEE
jgi:hypothetical protein